MKKIVFLVVVVIVALVCVGFAGIYTFTRAVYNNKNCEWANIDNIELRTASNIPSTLNSTCHFDEMTNTKFAVFQLNMEDFDVQTFIRKNNYKKYEGLSDMDISDMTTVTPAASTELFYRTDITEDDAYRMLLDVDRGELFVSISYKK